MTVSPEELASFWNRSFRNLGGSLPSVRSERIQPIPRRFLSEDEIKTLVEDFELSQFEVRENGSREIWLRKATS